MASATSSVESCSANNELCCAVCMQAEHVEEQRELNGVDSLLKRRLNRIRQIFESWLKPIELSFYRFIPPPPCILDLGGSTCYNITGMGPRSSRGDWEGEQEVKFRRWTHQLCNIIQYLAPPSHFLFLIMDLFLNLHFYIFCDNG